MLIELTIENFAIIDRLKVSFDPGLNVITGETGSGKSILIGALDFLLGGKVHKDLIRSGENKAVVEGSFKLPEEEFHEMIPDNKGLLLIRREFLRSGKSTARINNRSVAIQQLRKTGKLLVDILGQHEHQSLLDPTNHLTYLDALGNLTLTTNNFSAKYRLREEKEKRLKKIRSLDRQKEERKRLLEFQIDEIDGAALTAGEEENLTGESKALANADRIIQTSRNIVYQLQEADNSLLGILSGFDKDIQELSQMDKHLKPMEEGIDSARLQLEEVAFNLQRYLQEMDLNPQRQMAVEERLDELYRLKKKYNRSMEELLCYRETMGKELKHMEHAGEEAAELAGEVQRLSQQLLREARIISRQRKKAAENLQRRIFEELVFLGIPQCRFPVLFGSHPASENGLEVDGAAISETGIDLVEFLFSANPGEEPKSLSRIASGGELSRIMLGLKNILGRNDPIKTLIFDEVDVGIGGKTAYMVGKKLKDTADGHQVICITHLPQIARFAHRHLVVDKIAQADRMVSRIRVLDESQRDKEFDRMGYKGTS